MICKEGASWHSILLGHNTLVLSVAKTDVCTGAESSACPLSLIERVVLSLGLDLALMSIILKSLWT